MKHCIVGGRIVLPDRVLAHKALVFDEKIRAIIDENEARASGLPIVDAQGLYVSPGLVDVHIHGYMGADTSDGDAQGIRTMAQGVARNGVTSFLPTTMTVAWSRLEAVFELMRELRAESRTDAWQGAEILGIHAEGPFINTDKKGAQSADHILKPDARRVLPYKDIIRMITLAPECDEGFACIRALRAESDIVVSMGHTSADYDTAIEAMNAGVEHVTHLFNAMTPLTHRAPGVVGAALSSQMDCEMIADTFHINRSLFPMVCRLKGDHLVLITDCTRAGGLADGAYDLGGQEIFVKGIECRLKDGTIAGSVLKLNHAVRNVMNATGMPIFEAIRLASYTPCLSIGETRKGALLPGRDADIALFDEHMNVSGTWLRGRRIDTADAIG